MSPSQRSTKPFMQMISKALSGLGLGDSRQSSASLGRSTLPPSCPQITTQVVIVTSQPLQSKHKGSWAEGPGTSSQRPRKGLISARSWINTEHRHCCRIVSCPCKEKRHFLRDKPLSNHMAAYLCRLLIIFIKNHHCDQRKKFSWWLPPRGKVKT